MFTFHCKGGDVQVEKSVMMKYEEMLTDIVTGADELTIDFTKSIMKSMLYYANLVYNCPQLVTLVPYNIYPICDFFCMTQMTNPKLYYPSDGGAGAMIFILQTFVDVEHFMYNKLYNSILDDMKSTIRNTVVSSFAGISEDEACYLFKRLGFSDDEEFVHKVAVYYNGLRLLGIPRISRIKYINYANINNYI